MNSQQYIVQKDTPEVKASSSSLKTAGNNGKRKIVIDTRKLLSFSIYIAVIGALLTLAFLWIAPYVLSGNNPPKQVRITNVSSRSATVTWVTEKKDFGVVIFSEKQAFNGWPFHEQGVKRAYDDRDYALAEGKYIDTLTTSLTESKTESLEVNLSEQNFDESNYRITPVGQYYTHHITIKNLDPQKEYYFKVGNGYRYWNIDEIEQVAKGYDVPLTDVFSFKTFSENSDSASLKTPNPSYGKVMLEKEDGSVIESDDAIVFASGYKLSEINVPDASSSSLYLSAVPNTTGGWSIDKSNMRAQDGKFSTEYVSGKDKIYLAYQLGKNSLFPGNFLTWDIEDNPVNTITYKDYSVLSEPAQGNDQTQNLGRSLFSPVMAENATASPICCGIKLKFSDGSLSDYYIGDYEKDSAGKTCVDIFKSLENNYNGNNIARDSNNNLWVKEIDKTVYQSKNDSSQVIDVIDRTGCERRWYVLNDGTMTTENNQSVVNPNMTDNDTNNNNNVNNNEGPIVVISQQESGDGYGFDKGHEISRNDWDCSRSSYIGSQYWTCGKGGTSNPNYVYKCDNKGIPYEIKCSKGCSSSAVGSHDKCVEDKVNSPGGVITDPAATPVCCVGMDQKTGSETRIWDEDGECGEKGIANTNINIMNCHTDTKSLCCKPLWNTAGCPNSDCKWLENSYGCGYGYNEVQNITSKVACEGGRLDTSIYRCCATEISGNNAKFSWDKMDHTNTCATNPSKTKSHDILLFPSSSSSRADERTCKVTPNLTKRISIDVQLIRSALDNSSERTSEAKEYDAYLDNNMPNCNNFQCGAWEFELEVIKGDPNISFEDTKIKGLGDESNIEYDVLTFLNKYYFKVDSCNYGGSTGETSCLINNDSTYNFDNIRYVGMLCAWNNIAKGKMSDKSCPSGFSCKSTSKGVPGLCVSDIYIDIPTNLVRSSSGKGLRFKSFATSNLVSTDPDDSTVVIFSEDGLYDADLSGKYKTENTFFVKKESKYRFYVERNGIQGYQAPADQKTIKTNEDYLIDLKGIEISVDKVAKNFRIELAEGINMVSFPFLATKDGQGTYKASDLFYGADGKVIYGIKGIASFDNGRWGSMFMIDSSGRKVGQDFPLVFGRGYVIITTREMKGSDAIMIPGYEVREPVPVAYKAGWNLIGIHGYSQQFTAATLIDSVSDTEGLTADNVTKWSSDKSRYEGIQKIDSAVYGFDFPISKSGAYFVRISSFTPADSSAKSILWNPGGDSHGQTGNN